MRRLLPIIVACVALAACGGSTEPAAPAEAPAEGQALADVLAALDGLSGNARTEKLLELVEAEGATLNLYTSMSPALLEPVVEAFEDTYEVDLAVYRANSETVLQRLVEEADAGFHGADVVETSGLEMFNLSDAGIVVPYDSPARAGLIEEAIEDRWTASRINTFVVTWNTDLVPDGEQPTSWEELADPRWKGNVAIEAGDIDWYKTLWEHWVDEGMSPEEADTLFEQIAANALVVRGHTVLAQLLAAGEFAVGVNYYHTNELAAAEGAPVTAEPLAKPTIGRANGVGVIEGVPHPAAAILFVDWILADGQVVLDENETDPVRADIALPLGLVVDLESLATEQQEWTDRYDRLLQLGEEAGGS
jgi:iron(III) transport system substrate-binding protein